MFCKQRVALKAAGTGTGALQNSGRPQELPFPSSCTEGQRGAQRQSRICDTHTHTHFLSYPAPPPAAQQQSKTQHKELMDRTHCKGKVQWFCSSDRDIPLQSPSHPPKGQSCFTHLIFGRTGSAVTFPFHKKVSKDLVRNSIYLLLFHSVRRISCRSRRLPGAAQLPQSHR